jgi:orotate phosphoribosyltransferase
MELVPTQDEVIELLRETGGLRNGHFEYPNGLHSAQYLQVALTMRFYSAAKILSVGLSRLVRADSEIRAMIPQLSIVTPATGGLPVAYGVCEALHAKQVYWGERDEEDAMRLRQFLEVREGEKVLLVDDVLRSGRSLHQLREVVERRGAEIIGVAVMIHEPYPDAASFSGLPLFSLAKVESAFRRDAASCEQCKRGEPVTKVWI